MAIVRWTPLFPSSDEFDKWFDDLSIMPHTFNFFPAIDIYQTKDDVVVETPLAGINPADVDISIENDVLTLEGKAQKKSEVEEKDYYRKEVRYGSFHRSVALPVSVNGDKAKATYEKGVLKIVIPKEERVKPKTVKVEVKD